jgi:tetratricopeptide (TPR) repeat protein
MKSIFHILAMISLATLTSLLTGCSSASPARQTSPEIATAASSARIAFQDGQIERASQLYARALAKARSMDDAYEIANNAYNQAACLVTLGQYEQAQALLQEAERESRRADVSRTDILLMQAQVAQALGKTEEAQSILKEVLSDSSKPEYRNQATVLETRMACDAGDLAAAEAKWKELQAVAQRKDTDVLLKAEIQALAGRIAVMKDQPVEAAKAADQQIDFLKQGGKYREMAQVLGRAAELYGQAEQWQPSWDRAYRSARSLFAQGDAVGALRQVEQAVKAAEKTGDPESQAATASLFAEVRKAVEEAEKPKE